MAQNVAVGRRLSTPAATNRTGCPSAAAINAQLAKLEVVFQFTSDSDDRAKFLDAFLVSPYGRTTCMSGAQVARLHKLTATQGEQAHSEEASFNAGILGALGDVSAFLALLTKPETFIRAGELIGGAVLVVIGLKTLTGLKIPTPVGKI